MASYRVRVYSASTSDWSPDTLIAEFENPKNLGYASYLNDIGEAFFTISQYDPKVNIRAYEGNGHVVVIRDEGVNSDVVWRGILGEHDANARDVVFYAHGYESLLYSLYSKWNQKWRNSKIAGSSGRPVDDLWARAKAITDSGVQWITTGTLQAPTNASGGATDLTLNRYRVNWKRILTSLRELVAIATSDTSNITFMEIDYPSDPTDLAATFNFWKNNSSDNTKLRLTWGANVMDYNDRYEPVMFRNKTLGVGTGPRGQLYRYAFTVSGGTYGRDTLGMRMQNMYLSWVRDRKELKRVVKRRTRLALREDTNLWVRCFPDSVPPWRSTNSSWELGDRVYTDIGHGVTSIDKWLHMMGEQVVFVNGREYVQPMLEERAGVQSTYDGFTWIGADATTPWELANVAATTTTHSVTIPENSKIVMLMVAQDDEKNTRYITGVTLNGVAGTLEASQNGTGGFDRYVYAYSWLGASVPGGETVDLAVTHGTVPNGWTMGYGLMVAGSDISAPTSLDTATGTNSSGNFVVTLNSGLPAGIGVTVAIHDAGNGGAATGNTLLVNDHVLTTHRMSVSYETVAAAGSRSVGIDGNTRWSTVGVMVANDDS